jgi:outer membrane protein
VDLFVRASPASKWLSLGAASVALATASQAQADTLREALAAAYNNNPTLASARANQRATDEEVPIRRADGLPSLEGNSQ